MKPQHPPYTEEETTIARLASLNRHDPEAAHREADTILLDYLRSIGEGAVADAFIRAHNRVGFWYA